MFQTGANLGGGAFTGRSQPVSNNYPMDDEMDCIRDFEMQVQPDAMQYIETYREAGSDDQFLMIQAPEALSNEQNDESHDVIQHKASNNSVHTAEDLTLELQDQMITNDDPDLHEPYHNEQNQVKETVHI